MIFRVFLSLCLVLICNQAHTETETEYQTLIQAFQTIRTNSTWPVANSSFDDIEETFGPRIQPSTDHYDWHRGIDIDGAHGSNIVAVLSGTFDRYTNYASGGWTVVLKHPFPQPVTYNGTNLTHFYTYYMHLNDTGTPPLIKNAQKGDFISKGDTIGLMGNSGQGPGEDYAIHLHFELRVGANASLEFQLNNLNTTQWGFDPHMHPMLLYTPLNNTLRLDVIPTVTNTDFTRFRFTSSNDDQPLLNRIEISLINPATQLSVKQHILDLNRRMGFDASSITNLDLRNLSNPYLDPEYFLDAQTDYRTQIVIPKIFVENLLNTSLKVTVYDIWGNKLEYQNQTTSPELQPLASHTSHLVFQKRSQLLIWEINPTTFKTNASFTLTLPKHWKVINVNHLSSNTVLMVKRGSHYALIPFTTNSITELIPLEQKIRGKIVYVGDFDQNTTSDFIVQKGSSLSMMPNLATNNFHFTSNQFLTKTKAKLVGCGDFDSDGVVDLLYQKKTSLSAMNLKTFQSQAVSLALRPKEKVAKVVDLQNDNTPDIITRYKTSIELWLRNPMLPPTNLTLGSQDRSWKIVDFY